MRSFWKVFAALALTLPLGAFVAGNLVASAADDPEPRNTIIIDDQSATPSGDPSPSSTPGHDATDDHGGGGDHGGDNSADLPEATQTPDDWDDDSSGHGGDDNSGSGSGSHGGGSDDSGGHGGGSDDSGGHGGEDD